MIWGHWICQGEEMRAKSKMEGDGTGRETAFVELGGGYLGKRFH